MDRPTDADRIMALSVLRGHVITDDPKVQRWVQLYRDFEPCGNPWDLDMVTGGWPYEAVSGYVYQRLEVVDDCA